MAEFGQLIHEWIFGLDTFLDNFNYHTYSWRCNLRLLNNWHNFGREFWSWIMEVRLKQVGNANRNLTVSIIVLYNFIVFMNNECIDMKLTSSEVDHCKSRCYCKRKLLSVPQKTCSLSLRVSLFLSSTAGECSSLAITIGVYTRSHTHTFSRANAMHARSLPSTHCQPADWARHHSFVNEPLASAYTKLSFLKQLTHHKQYTQNSNRLFVIR